MNYHIGAWLSETGVIQPNYTDRRKQKLVEGYWRYLANIIHMYATKTEKV